jgi:hypothetical protein
MTGYSDCYRQKLLLTPLFSKLECAELLRFMTDPSLQSIVMSLSNRSSTTSSSRGSSQPPPPFLSKLLAMLSSNQCQPYISWSSTGQYIILRSVEDLGSKMLPLFFRHNKFASFLRQVRCSCAARLKKKHVKIRISCSCTFMASAK